MGITVVINTYNASRTLPSVLGSVKGFDEVIVCDLESTDNTKDIARAKGARVIEFPKKHYDYPDPARNYTISRALNEWVLVLNQDEVVPSGLREWLYKMSAVPGKAKGLWIPRRNYIFDRFQRTSYPDYQLRFFMRDYVDWPAEYNSSPEVKGELKKIPSNKHDLALIHLPSTVERMIDRIQWHTRGELTIQDRVRGVTLFDAAVRPFLSFFNTYILRGGFRYGLAGFIQSATESTTVFYKHAKMYEAGLRDRIESLAKGKVPEEVYSVWRDDETDYAGQMAREEAEKARKKDEIRDSDANL